MPLTLAAKSTKPGSKAAYRSRADANGRPARVPVGTLHLVDPEAQSPTQSMFTAVCTETSLIAVDGSWDDDFPNDRCAVCADHQWMSAFGEMQAKLLP